MLIITFMHLFVILFFNLLKATQYLAICWFVRGRIKEKISTIYAIKYQVYCMENTVQWTANTVQLF